MGISQDLIRACGSLDMHQCVFGFPADIAGALVAKNAGDSMRCSNCSTVLLDDANFCHKCGEPFPKPDAAVSAPQSIDQPGAWAHASTSPQLSINEAGQWGAHINRDDHARVWGKPAVPSDFPAWLMPGCADWWQDRGLVIWDKAAQSMECLNSQRALDLLQKLRSTTEWRSEGVPITYRLSILKGMEEKPPRRSRKRKPAEAQPAETEKPTYETVDAERFRLAPSAGEKLMAFLQEHESLLRVMAQEDEETRQRAYSDVLRFLCNATRRAELQELDLASRPLPWTRSAHEHRLVCDLPPNRATICVEENGIFWQACIEQPDRFKRESPHITHLKDALDWAEQELKKIEEEARQEAAADAATDAAAQPLPSLAETAAMLKADLSRFWIDPSRLEPERITYAVVMQLEYAPYDFKTMELSFGKLRSYDERFLTAERVARELGINLAHVIDKQYADIGLYEFTSNATYFLESLAAAQAQQLWDHSQAVAQFKAGKVKWAYYGYKEVETEYHTWLGGCASKDARQPEPSTREEHMLRRAIEETLAYALDVRRFREYRQFPSAGLEAELLTDERLLESLHRRRSRSPYVPQAAKQKSLQWLARRQ
jgi:hypothetical protein